MTLRDERDDGANQACDGESGLIDRAYAHASAAWRTRHRVDVRDDRHHGYVHVRA